MNMISTFIDTTIMPDRNLFDYLQRCDKYGLKVNLSLRPGTPMDFEWDKMREMIVQNRLAQSDTVFAYDLAWEPFLGRQSERTRWTSAGASGSSGTTPRSKRRNRPGASPCLATQRAT